MDENLKHGDRVTWDNGRLHGYVVAVNYIVASTGGQYWRITACCDDGGTFSAESSYFKAKTK